MKYQASKDLAFLLVVLPAFGLLLLSFSSGIRIIHKGENHLNQNKVVIDQLGYRPDDLKIAFVKSIRPDSFYIINSLDNEIEYKGIYNSIEFDQNTGDNLYKINFSVVTKPGNYKISIPGYDEVSYEFAINKNVYNECLLKTLQSFYFQRCGIEIYNGSIWAHHACHLRNAGFFDDPSKKINTSGGWHDAGDYNKFVPTTAVSAAFLLYAYEVNPKFFYDGQLNIPESKDSIPDILNEAIWGLKWLLKMQREDGAVYHKVSIKKWTAEHLPEEEKDEQYIFGISTCSTADVAAVTALGARLIGNFDKQLSIDLLKCSLKAWHFLMMFPENIPKGGFKNPPGVQGGEYSDNDDSDERLWAAMELYRLTGSDEYLNYFLSNYKKVSGPNYTLSWENTQNFAYYSFLKQHPFPQGVNYKSALSARDDVISNMHIYCDDLISRIETGGYKCALNKDQYYWGSNSVVAGYAFDLLNLHLVTNQRKYLEAALDQLHYLLGRNTFNVSFITGVGTNPVKYPYHQFSMLKYPGNPVPGLLVAGPNSKSKLNGKEISNMPGRCYEDNEKNYYVNEVAINYTAPLVFITSYLSQSSEKSLSEEISRNPNSGNK